MTVRFIHTADIHLDSPLSGLSAYADAPLLALRTATRRAFEGLIEQAIGEQVDFVVIAGDLFDGTWKDYNTGLFFIAQMGRLKQVGIRVVLLYGNHDAESDLTRAARLRLPDNVNVFDSNAAHSIAFQDLKVVFHGRSFWQRDVTENLIKQYPERVVGWFNIGVLHTALSGREGHASYAPASLDDLRSKGYEYWALGHVHEGELLGQNPHIVFPGSLQGRHIREAGAHGAYLVQVDDTQVRQLTRITTDVLRWQNIDVNVTACNALTDVLLAFENALGNALDTADGRPLAVRVHLGGTSRLHGELFRQEALVRAQMQAIALGFGPERAWVEKLRIETTAPSDFLDVLTSGDVLSDLRLMFDEAASDPTLVGELEKEFSDLSLKLLPEVRSCEEPMLTQVRQARVDELIRTVAPLLLSQIAER
jgi:DNA repair exonuclease SbcCD nuclease subunit